MDAAIILRRRAGRFVAVALTATAGLALLPGTPSGAATTDATISNFAFAPNPLDAPVGATVKWTNDDGTSHTVTADDGSFDSGPIGAGGTFTRTFGQVRTIAYHCNIHPGMHGTLQIGGGATTTTTAAPTTTTTAGPTTTTTADPVTTTAPPPASPATTAPAPTATTAPRSTTTKPVPAAPASRPSAPAPEPAAVAAVTPATSSAAAPASGPGATTAAGGESTAAPAATGPTPPSPDLSTDTGASPASASAAASAPPDEAARGVTTDPARHGGAGPAGIAAVTAGLALVGGGGRWAMRRRRHR